MHDCTIILDLDETLIQAVKKKKDKLNIPHAIYGSYHVYMRNHIDKFLMFCFKQFKRVILWTAATHDYGQTITSLLMSMIGDQDFSFYKVITRDTYGTTTKDIDNIKHDEEIDGKPIYFVDDIAKRIKNLDSQYIIIAQPYKYNNLDDDYLNELIELLEGICLSLQIK